MATVLACYQRFLDRFSTAYDLAAAELNHVLKAWEGLGYYYAQARNLHAPARPVVERLGVNGLPTDKRMGGRDYPFICLPSVDTVDGKLSRFPLAVADQQIIAALQSAGQRRLEPR
ncbi:unnamed protein product [marine sediment metagenome]|uniref:HhH-GPD domain-containing protein n=1 Tax=marine sediment metagenome TaxID=412755 RepID=X0Y2E1_9ZZZZ